MHLKIKKNFFNLIVQYLGNYSDAAQQLVLPRSASYISAAFMFASRHPQLEKRYCTTAWLLLFPFFLKGVV